MEKLYFNRLIRDKILDKLIGKGLVFRSRELSEEEFEKELVKKVPEEGEGLVAAKTREEFLMEFGDLLYVIDEIKRVKKISDQELNEIKKNNFDKKGSFSKRIYLEWTSDDGYQTNEKK